MVILKSRMMLGPRLHQALHHVFWKIKSTSGKYKSYEGISGTYCDPNTPSEVVRDTYDHICFFEDPP